MDISELKNEVLREVGMLARCIQSISDIAFRELRLQRGQFVFLTRICERPGINLIELSTLLKVDKATTTKAVQKLMDAKYVLRERGSQDLRMWHLFPSPEGQAIYPLIIEEEHRNIDICFDGFTPEERQTAYLLIRRMRENIEQDWKSLKTVKTE